MLLRRRPGKVKPHHFERNERRSCLFIKYRLDFLLAAAGIFRLHCAGISTNDNAMIKVSNLTKRYAGRTAVSDISFTVAPQSGVLGRTRPRAYRLAAARRSG